MGVEVMENDTRGNLASLITCLLGGGGQSREQMTIPGTPGKKALGDMLGAAGGGCLLLIIVLRRVLCPSANTRQTHHGDSFVSKREQERHVQGPSQMSNADTYTHICVTCHICDLLICACTASLFAF